MYKYNFIHPEKFWDDVATTDRVFSSICDGFTEKDFEDKKESLIFNNKLILEPSDVFLDVGCGIGRIAKFVAPHVSSYTGVDISTNMIERAKLYNKKLSNVDFIKTNGKDLSELKNNTYTKVICEQVFIHMTKEGILKYIEEVYRILVKGGVFIFWGPSDCKYVNGLSNKEWDNALSHFTHTDTDILSIPLSASNTVETGITYSAICTK